MNKTPRALNRILLAVIGLTLMAAGALAMLVTIPAVGQWWRFAAGQAGRWSGAALRDTTLPGQRDSWLWIALIAVMALTAILMIAWAANQGRGRSGIFARDDDGTTGTVTITASAVEQALKAALQERGDLVNSAVATYEFRREPAVRIRVFPRQGVAPHVIAEEVSALVEALDLVAGRQAPVLISISAGARTRFTRAERVR